MGGIPLRYNTVILDLDGTLVDSEAFLRATFAATLEELGYPPPDEAAFEGFFRKTNAEAFAYLNHGNLQRVLDCLHGHQVRFAHLTVLYPGCGEMVRTLKEMGCRLGFVTSRARMEVLEDPAVQPLLPLIDAIVSEEDTEKHKPAPEPMRLCMERLSASADSCIYVGDSVSDARSAHGAGLPFALACWGAADPAAEAEFHPGTPEDFLKIVRG